jgi:hypothetical protein
VLSVAIIVIYGITQHALNTGQINSNSYNAVTSLVYVVNLIVKTLIALHSIHLILKYLTCLCTISFPILISGLMYSGAACNSHRLLFML